MCSCCDIAYGPHNPVNYALQKLVIYDGGAMMGRRAMRNIELSARVGRRKPIPLRIQGALLGRGWKYDRRLHERIACPELRWVREVPRVGALRAPITEDPNWPPCAGRACVPPVAENNAKCGWAPQKAEENNRRAAEKERALLEKLGMELAEQ